MYIWKLRGYDCQILLYFSFRQNRKEKDFVLANSADRNKFGISSWPLQCLS